MQALAEIAIHSSISGASLLLPGIVSLGLVVAALWGVSDFLGGFASRRAPALTVVLIAHSLSAAMLVLAALATHAAFPGQRIALWALAAGLSGGGALIVFYRALAEGEMSLAAALTGVLTALVPVVVSWISEGRPKPIQIFGFAIAVAAICLIAYEPRGRVHPRGLGLAAIAGLGFGVFLVTSKYASEGTVLWPLAYSRLTSTALAGCIFLAVEWRRGAQGNRARRRGISGGLLQLGVLAGAAGVLEALGNLLYMLDTKMGRLDVTAVLASLYPAGPILLGVWILGERTTRAKAAGIVLALVAVAVISMGAR